MRSHSPSLERYLETIATIPILSKTEEETLVRQRLLGDTLAEERLVRANLRFVAFIARSFDWSDVPLEDLINAGNMGLVVGIRKYELGHGARLLSYVVWWILRYIREEIAMLQHIIPKPADYHRELNIIRRTLEKSIAEQSGKPLTPEQLTELGISESQLNQAYEPMSHASLDAPRHGLNETTLLESLSDASNPDPHAPLEQEHHQRILITLMADLTEEESAVVKLAKGLIDGTCHHPKEMSDMLGLSVTVVNARLSVAMRKMNLRARALKDQEGGTPFSA
ncbi:MAG: sigma-70 family RNA polymerase sigma factor [Patescibacteria group bacterium]